MATIIEKTHDELFHIRWIGNKIELKSGELMNKKRIKPVDVTEMLYQANKLDLK